MHETLAERCGNYYLLGDSGYPCMQHLLTPYKDRGNLRQREINFNEKLAKNRYIIEHCFGILKQKFRQLYHIKLRKIPAIVHFIRACCVLHNLALNDELPDALPDAVDDNVPGQHVNNAEAEQDHVGGIETRNRVADMLPFN